MASIKKRTRTRTITDDRGRERAVEVVTWVARYRDASGSEHKRHFRRQVDGQAWLDQETAKLVTGTWTSPKHAKMTVGEWCDLWLAGYATRRASTVRQARVHVAQIRKQFGDVAMSGVRPSAVKAWTVKLKAEGLKDSYVNALHRRLSQILGDAVHDNLIPRNPCSRRTSPGGGKQRPYVATTEQVWALYDAFPEHLRPAVLLGAFAGLRTSEACGLRVTDVDFMRGVVKPAVQYPAVPLKTDTSKTPVPIPAEMALELASYVERYGSSWVVTDGIGGQGKPWSVERAIRSARAAHVRPLPDGHAKDCAGCRVPGLPAEFRFHDLRHYLASLLIADGADVKVVQARLRHGSAKTTLDVYMHLWPDSDASTRATVGAVFAARADVTAASVRPRGVQDGR